jgi:hypothetical protein
MLVYFTAIWNILRPFRIFYGHFEYFTAISNILRPFGICYSHLAILPYFPLFWYIVLRKIWQPCAQVVVEGSNERAKLIESIYGKSIKTILGNDR